MEICFNNTPDYLKRHGYFCLWRYEERGGKRTKVPYNPKTLQRGDSTNKAAFVSFMDIVKIWTRVKDRFDGVGIGIFDMIGAIDIDHCFQDGKISELALDIINRMNSYTEVSPSGEGIRIFFGIRDTTWYDKQKYFINNRKLGIEIYLPGTTNRFLTFTGNCYEADL